jgi:hypothetical protein
MIFLISFLSGIFYCMWTTWPIGLNDIFELKMNLILNYVHNNCMSHRVNVIYFKWGKILLLNYYFTVWHCKM